MLLGNFHCCKWLNIEEIIKPSGHASFYLNIRHDHGGGIAVHTLALSMSSNAADKQNIFRANFHWLWQKFANRETEFKANRQLFLLNNFLLLMLTVRGLNLRKICRERPLFKKYILSLY